MIFRRELAVLLLVVLTAPACRVVRQVAAKYPRPDMALLYGDAVQNRARNPVILIPGFAGSELVRGDDVVWGTLFNRQGLRYAGAEGFRALALDIAELPPGRDHRRLAALQDDTVASAPLGHFKADALVTHVNFDVYASILQLLGDAGYITGRARHDLGYDPDHYNCFTFFYDWRLDNVANARALGRFIAAAREEVVERRRQRGLSPRGDQGGETLPEREVKFDVVAHSMGGLIARYYLRYGTEDVLGRDPAEIPWTGARDVDRLILISTPNLGVMKVLRDLIHGRKPMILPKVQATLVASMISTYQMLPRPRQPLIRGDDGESVDFDFFDVAHWIEHRWGPFASDQEPYLAWLLPDLGTAEARRRYMADFMRLAFERARLFAAALDRPAEASPPTVLVLFAGDGDPTLQRARLGRRDDRVVLDFDGSDLTAPGDGTVTRASALADERWGPERRSFLRSPVPWSWTYFISDRHTTFLRNPTLQDNLLHILLERPPVAQR